MNYSKLLIINFNDLNNKEKQKLGHILNILNILTFPNKEDICIRYTDIDNWSYAEKDWYFKSEDAFDDDYEYYKDTHKVINAKEIVNSYLLKLDIE